MTTADALGHLIGQTVAIPIPAHLLAALGEVDT